MNTKHLTRHLRYFFQFIPDRLYLKVCYRIKMHKKLNLKNPQTFNEKVQWLKLYNRNPQYTEMVDKYRVRDYVSQKVGGDINLIPLVGGPYYSVKDIDFDKLPDQFVLKCNHDSGSTVICKDKKYFDFVKARKKLNYCLRHNFWYLGREWPYRNVKPCIIAEEYMTDESGTELKDYKIFNFNGEPKIIQVDFDRFVQHKKNLYTTEWDYIEAAINYPADPCRQIEKPRKLEEMLLLASMLSKDIPYLRTDFYIIKDRIYFGELTFYPGSGFMSFTPEEFDLEIGNWIKLPERNVF